MPGQLQIPILIYCTLLAAGCVNLKKGKATDKRTYGYESPESDAGPGTDTLAVTDGTDPLPTDSAPANPPIVPDPFLLQDGFWQIERVTCTDNRTETLDSIWSYSQKGATALFTKKSTGGCQNLQEAGVTVSDRKIVLVPGNTRCEGVCPTECAPLMPSGNDILVTTEPGPGGAALKSGLPMILDFCIGKQPASIFMSPRKIDECPVKWKTVFGNGSMQIFDGKLRWNIPAIRKLQSHTLVHTFELKGDFTIAVAYKGLEAVGRGAYFKVSLVDLDDPRYQAFVMAGNYSAAKGETDIHQAAVVTDGNFIDPPNSATESRSQSEGTMTIEKRGTKVKSSSGSQGDTNAEKSNPDDRPFTTGRYQLILSLGSNSNLTDIKEVTSVNIDLVAVNDGTGTILAATDAFDCASIK